MDTPSSNSVELIEYLRKLGFHPRQMAPRYSSFDHAKPTIFPDVYLICSLWGSLYLQRQLLPNDNTLSNSEWVEYVSTNNDQVIALGRIPIEPIIEAICPKTPRNITIIEEYNKTKK